VDNITRVSVYVVIYAGKTFSVYHGLNSNKVNKLKSKIKAHKSNASDQGNIKKVIKAREHYSPLSKLSAKSSNMVTKPS
jgi:hypothetical protein